MQDKKQICAMRLRKLIGSVNKVIIMRRMDKKLRRMQDFIQKQHKELSEQRLIRTDLIDEKSEQTPFDINIFETNLAQ